jgi:hypothetical protein
LICPGRALANATSSFTVFAGSEGCVTRRLDSDTTCEIGAKSLSASYGTFLYIAGLIASVLMPISRV